MTARQADLSLVLVTAIWATTFVIVKDATEEGCSPLLFLGIRMVIAVLALAAMRPGILREARAGGFRYGLPLGIVFFFGIAAQNIGLKETTPSRSAFISSLAVVLVPFAEIATRRKLPSRAVLAALPLSVTGLALLTDPWAKATNYPSVLLGLNAGDLWTLASTGFFTVQLLVSERATQTVGAGALSVHQVLVCGVLAFGGAGLLEANGLVRPLRFVPSIPLFLALAATGVLATALAFLVWLAAQKRTSAARAALIFTLEPVLAAAFSWALGREVLSGMQYVGGGLIVLALLLAQATFLD
jgi:drug/metabolite transporter (DMT)-like permease